MITLLVTADTIELSNLKAQGNCNSVYIFLTDNISM